MSEIIRRESEEYIKYPTNLGDFGIAFQVNNENAPLFERAAENIGIESRVVATEGEKIALAPILKGHVFLSFETSSEDDCINFWSEVENLSQPEEE